MGAIQDGWLLYYENNLSPPVDAIDGQLCIVRTAEGRTLARIVRKGWRVGHWDLGTVTGDQAFDVKLEWAELVTLIQPHAITAEEKAFVMETEDQ